MKTRAHQLATASSAASVAADVRRLKLNAWQCQHRLKLGRRLAPVFLALAAALANAATITWDGGGGDLSWQNRFNWSGDQVPGTSDDAVINVPTNVTVVSSVNTTVRSVQCQGGLLISGGNFEVTAGLSIVDGPFTLTATAYSLYVNAWAGGPVVFAARGPTVIESAVSAAYGASVLLTNLTSLVVSNGNVNVTAGSVGGLVDLSRVTNVVVASGCRLWVAGSTGGRIDLRQARITGNNVQAIADGAGSVVDFSGLSGEWGASSRSSWTVQNGGAILIPNVTGLMNVSLTLGGANATPIGQLRSIRQGELKVYSSAPDFSGLTNVDGSYLEANSGATLNLSNVRVVAEFNQANADGGATLLLTNVTSLVLSNVFPDIRATGGGLLDLSRVTNVVWMQNLRLNVYASSGGRINLRGLESITGFHADFLADGAGSVIDLSRLSGFLTPLSPWGSSLKAQNGGVILINNSAVFLLANVAVALPGLIVQATPAMVLHALPWHSYWVEQRDVRQADSPWVFTARVPMTNTFQTFAAAPPPDTAFRASEFVADPPIVELWAAGAAQAQLLLYGATNQSYQVESAPSLADPIAWSPGDTAAMTNSFRFFAPMPATDATGFFRVREL